ncbi:MAG TPA: hypothetical protein DDX01_03650 [Holosporales bacterium]|nr:hypothetical protein [Holosporales bacterium]
MSKKPMAEIQECLILFADVIDSSKYSSVLGPYQYCSYILKYQQLFKFLAQLYFPENSDKNDFARIRIHGDEGAIFVIYKSLPKEEVVALAIQFSFELKARMEIEFCEKDRRDVLPQKMEVGVGIHFGEVALVVSDGKEESISSTDEIGKIDRVEGYAINYAKRLESASRLGLFSKVILSQEAATLVRNKSFILNQFDANFKGISGNEHIYEVRSAFFHNVPLADNIVDYDNFIKYYVEDSTILNFVRKPWLKSFVVSIIDSQIRRAHLKPQAQMYWSKMVSFAWRDPNENDPILLFIRALDMRKKGEENKWLCILRDIISLYPTFNSARKDYVKALWNKVKKDKDNSQASDVSDMVREYLDKYPHMLRPKEIEELQNILGEIKTILEEKGDGA